MTELTRRTLITSLAVLPLAHTVQAALTPYALAPARSSVGFTYNLSGATQTGTMSIKSANIMIDVKRLQNSRVDVTLDVTGARTKLPFARGPMLSKSVLNAARYPTIRFITTRIKLGPTGRISEGATVTGNLNVRDVTRPVTLKASLFRKPGSAADELDALSIKLTGALNRHEFGASGYPELVHSTVGLNIHAEITRQV
ncbi:Polyisoprenoid-binding protein YceI [Ruegeria halocynthiae]|uniref:Polyisoprenoid-binding protein YceI n=1 Tax=Ruegeria halocynthiae TaxID=985054 RepID=A0A1H2U3T3_9RHOB|nr:YceI family protein [Ruegeria halocynthiae]SDW50249.1 Polyisoprenoid-binding protein YceI [Ruegeria halocynthiae]